MSQHVTQQSELPDAPFYVTTTVRFMSGWGKSRGLTNRLVLACESQQEANRVADYARGRSDQKNVRICTTKPRIRPGTYTQVMDPERSTAWYGRNEA